MTPVEPRVYGSENGGSRITLRATQDSWIQVRAGPDELLLTRVLRAGDTYLVPNRLGVTMQTAIANAICLTSRFLKKSGWDCSPDRPPASLRSP